MRHLLEAPPNLTILLTSRQRLNVEGERELTVPPLQVVTEAADPPIESPGIQLFLDRARAVRPNFVLSDANLPTVIALCEPLEGIPLAMELCAAWALTLMQMLTRL